MTNEDLERARIEEARKWLHYGDGQNLAMPQALAEFRAEGEQKVFERCIAAMCWKCAGGELLAPNGRHYDDAYKDCPAELIRAAFPEYARTEEQKS
jgi:hypothetical protein